MPSYKLRLVSVKKFIPLYGACRPMNFSEQVDNLFSNLALVAVFFCYFSLRPMKSKPCGNSRDYYSKSTISTYIRHSK